MYLPDPMLYPKKTVQATVMPAEPPKKMPREEVWEEMVKQGISSIIMDYSGGWGEPVYAETLQVISKDGKYIRDHGIKTIGNDPFFLALEEPLIEYYSDTWDENKMYGTITWSVEDASVQLEGYETYEDASYIAADL